MRRSKASSFAQLAAIAISLAAANVALAAPVSCEDALLRADAWLDAGGSGAAASRSAASTAQKGTASARGAKERKRMRPSRSPSGRVRTCSIDGTNLFHLVELDGGGFVTVAADDDPFPILGFSNSGELPDSAEGNPFWALVGGGAVRRRFTISDSNVAKPAASRPAAKAIRAGYTNPIYSQGGVDDVRVEPLVKSKWSQSTVGDKKVYNYYTPSGYLCGCVATAMAQLMRFHGFPTNSVRARQFTCYINDKSSRLTMKGGTYDWDNMPLEPTSDITDAQCEAIGRICYDAGVAIRMDYNMDNSGESGAFGQFIHDPMVNVFGYASAQTYAMDFTGDNSDPYDAIPMEIVENAILANLDAGYPTLLGINGRLGGHSIVADGYGYADGTLYCHLNMGWSGSQDYWYALPEDFSDGFSIVNSVTYNVFPDTTGQIATGRVLDPFGEPVEGATVTAQTSFTYELRLNGQNISVNSSYTSSATTSSSGHYAIFAPTNYICSHAIAASYGDWSSTNAVTATTSPSASPFGMNYGTGDYSIPESGLAVGNSWGNDLYLAPTNVVAANFTSFAMDGTGGEVSFHATPGARYRLEYTLSLSTPNWITYTSILVPASGDVSLPIPDLGDVPSAFFRVVSE